MSSFALSEVDQPRSQTIRRENRPVVSDQVRYGGWLLKYSSNKQWQKRYMRLMQTDLVYSKSLDGGSRRIIPLSTILKVTNYNAPGMKNAFAVYTTERTYVFCCDREFETQMWVGFFHTNLDLPSSAVSSNSMPLRGGEEDAIAPVGGSLAIKRSVTTRRPDSIHEGSSTGQLPAPTNAHPPLRSHNSQGNLTKSVGNLPESSKQQPSAPSSNQTPNPSPVPAAVPQATSSAPPATASATSSTPLATAPGPSSASTVSHATSSALPLKAPLGKSSSDDPSSSSSMASPRTRRRAQSLYGLNAKEVEEVQAAAQVTRQPRLMRASTADFQESTPSTTASSSSSGTPTAGMQRPAASHLSKLQTAYVDDCILLPPQLPFDVLTKPVGEKPLPLPAISVRLPRPTQPPSPTTPTSASDVFVPNGTSYRGNRARRDGHAISPSAEPPVSPPRTFSNSPPSARPSKKLSLKSRLNSPQVNRVTRSAKYIVDAEGNRCQISESQAARNASIAHFPPWLSLDHDDASSAKRLTSSLGSLNTVPGNAAAPASKPLSSSMSSLNSAAPPSVLSGSNGSLNEGGRSGSSPEYSEETPATVSKGPKGKRSLAVLAPPDSGIMSAPVSPRDKKDGSYRAVAPAGEVQSTSLPRGRRLVGEELSNFLDNNDGAKNYEVVYMFKRSEEPTICRIEGGSTISSNGGSTRSIKKPDLEDIAALMKRRTEFLRNCQFVIDTLSLLDFLASDTTTFNRCVREVAVSATAIHLDILERMSRLSNLEMRQQMRMVYNRFVDALLALVTKGGEYLTKGNNESHVHDFYDILRLGRDVVDWARGLEVAF